MSTRARRERKNQAEFAAAVLTNTRKRVENMTRAELMAVPSVAWMNADLPPITALVLLPTQRKHDSGYGVIHAVAVGEDGLPIAKVTTNSDVLHLGGIRGGHPSAWSIDLLCKSQCFQVFSPSASLRVGPALSSFEVFVAEKKR